MAGYLMEMFAVSLALTVLIELAVMYFLLGIPGLHSGKQELAETTEKGGTQRVAETTEKGGTQRAAETTEKGGTQRAAETTEKGGIQELVAETGKGETLQPVSKYRKNVTQKLTVGTEKRNAPWIPLVVLINVLTNPPAVLVCWLGRMYLPPALHFPLQLAVEAAVIAAEAALYRSFSGKLQWKMKNPVILSVVVNGCSWSMGILIMALR